MKTDSLAPICIASPVRRSGTTLIQRLLCSSSNALIYGESCANDLYMLTNLLASKQMFFLSGKNWRNSQLESVLQNQVNNWIPDLMPDIDGYLESCHRGFFSIIEYFAKHAFDVGRPIWGMKLPEWNPANIVQIKKMLPNCKVIYLHRNLEDCLRSAKKIEMVTSLTEVQQFCQTYKMFLQQAKMQLSGDRVLFIEYEHLIEYPEKVIAQIAAFTGAENMDPHVLNIKINTFLDDHRLQKENNQFLAPAELTAAELEQVQSALRTVQFI